MLLVAYWVFTICISVTGTINVARNLTTMDLTDLHLRSQIDGNLVCIDSRFKDVLLQGILVRNQAFMFRDDITDFLFYAFRPNADVNLKKCSDVIVYQSQIAYFGIQNQNIVNFAQHFTLLEGVEVKKYSLIHTGSEDSRFSKWVSDLPENEIRSVLL